MHVDRAIQRCDVLINVGSRFDDRVTGKAATFAPHAKIIHVDVDPSEIGKLVPVHVSASSATRRVLRALIEAAATVREARRTLPRVDRRGARAAGQVRAAAGVSPPARYPALQPHDVCALLNDGATRRWATRRHRRRPAPDVGGAIDRLARAAHHMTSGGSGTMGFAVPAALGAAVACPDETIWVIVGDGGFQMTNQEIATMARRG